MKRRNRKTGNHDQMFPYCNPTVSICHRKSFISRMATSSSTHYIPERNMHIENRVMIVEQMAVIVDPPVSSISLFRNQIVAVCIPQCLFRSALFRGHRNGIVLCACAMPRTAVGWKEEVSAQQNRASSGTGDDDGITLANRRRVRWRHFIRPLKMEKLDALSGNIDFRQLISRSLRSR